jgi:ferredoxin-NADP reductase
MSIFSDTERELVVSARHMLSPRIAGFSLTSPAGRPLPEWTAGSHIDLILPDGRERQYSLCGDPSVRDSWHIAVLREDDGGGGSAAVHRLQVGELVRVRGPRSNFPFPQPLAGERVILAAGGIGITPMRAMVFAAATAGAEWTLDYAGRAPDEMAFADELAARHPDRVRVHAGTRQQRLDVEQLVHDRGDGRIWACGPRRFLDAFTEACSSLPEDVLTIEPFESSIEQHQPDVPFDVEIASSGEVISVPVGMSALSAIEEQGIYVPASCREGRCGTCETVVIDGDVDHRDVVLSPREKAQSLVMMVCVSRASGRLVVDL